MGVKEFVKTAVSFVQINAPCRVQAEVYREQRWLYSLTAAGRKDLRYLSFSHLGFISLLLKELPSAVTVTCRRRDSCTSSDDSLSIILLSPTTCTGSRGHPKMNLAFLKSCQEFPLHSKGPELPQQIQSALTFLVCSCSVISPLYCSCELPGTYMMSPSQCLFPGCSPVCRGCLCL